MKLLELFESIGTSYYHLTDVTAVIDMLQNKRFKLEPDHGELSLSLSRSSRSGFFTMMIGPDAVMVILDANYLKSHYDIKPYTNSSGTKQLASVGITSSEYEDRLYGTSKYVEVDPAAFKEIRILKTNVRSKGTNFYTDEQLKTLHQLCEKFGITLKFVSSKQDLRKKF